MNEIEVYVFDITKFTLKDMTVCGSTLRHMEEFVNHIVDYLNHNFVNSAGEKACVMVRKLF